MTKLTDAELAEKVAVEVMGWVKIEPDDLRFACGGWLTGTCFRRHFDPCNDWNDAMSVVKELEKDLIFFELKSYEYKNYVMYAADFYINNGLDRASVSRVIRKNPLEAITLAALKAKGVEL